MLVFHLKFFFRNDCFCCDVANETCELIICVFIMYAVSPSHSVFQPREAVGVTSFTAGAVTRSNRTFTRMSLNAAALCIATNNSRHPSKNVTKNYDATQRVKVDNEFLDLEEAVKHNVNVMVLSPSEEEVER